MSRQRQTRRDPLSMLGSVKALQVEDTLCLTGGSDGTVRLWDLRVVEDYEDRLKRSSINKAAQDPLDRIAEQNAIVEQEEDDEDWEEGPSGYTDLTQGSQTEGNGPCVRVLEGHSKSVTALYYEDGCLVSLLRLYFIVFRLMAR